MGKSHPPVPITGVWLRRSQGSSGLPSAEVLVEVDGAWRLLGYELLDSMFSHIWEQNSFRDAPVDPLGDSSAEESLAARRAGE